MKSLSETLKDERKKRGLTQVQAAIEIGISYQNICSLEQGRNAGKTSREKIEVWLKKN